MAIRPRTRKRVQAARRAADGSAFEKCEECGDTIAIALFDMHECGERKREVKRFKCISSGKVGIISKPVGSFEDEPRSPFIFFLYSNQNLPLENYGGNLGDAIANRMIFNVWNDMSKEERKPFIDRASEVDLAHNMKLNEEAQSFCKADDEADSKDVGKFDKGYERYDHEEEDCDSSDDFGHEFWDDDSLPEL
ncbi:unnamed protein product [Microthlaspi erraticum]|uniref:HMG box domain-containing protein n=1 Tax=Microthlaspi erraticum TaxID=1685480 RepID=A0A6D2J4B5_9BRAS|nr:unnamed protein product [Microthlaspi erraticum]